VFTMTLDGHGSSEKAWQHVRGELRRFSRRTERCRSEMYRLSAIEDEHHIAQSMKIVSPPNKHVVEDGAPFWRYR
jgi:hypothetical protein